MYTIKIGTTSKKINSTSQTYTVHQQTESASLKRPCSIERPVFTFKCTSNLDNLAQFNYLEWIPDEQQPENKLYYWIDSRKFLANNLVEFSCHRDPYASFKSSITGYTGMVARSSSGFDTAIMDTELLVSSKQAKLIFKDIDVKYGNYTSQGGAVFGQSQFSATWQTIGKTGTRIFNVQMLPEQTLDELLNGSGTWDFGVTNPGQYIADCFILPFCKASYPDSTLIPLGNLEAAISVVHYDISPTDVTDSVQSLSFVFEKSTHYNSLAYADGDFRNYTEKFTKVKIWAPFVGSIDIPAVHLKATKIVGSYFISWVNGQGKFLLNALYTVNGVTTSTLIMSSNINMRTEIPIAMGHTNQLQIANDITQAVNTAAQLVGSLATGAAAFASGGGAGLAMAAPGMTQSLVNAGGTAVNIAADWASGFQEYTCLGSSGSLAEVGGDYKKAGIIIQQMDTVSEDVNHERGRSTMKYGQIGNTNRFIAMYNPSLNIKGATAEEISTINATLASGLYIE